MKKLFMILSAVLIGLSHANATSNNYGLVIAGYNEFDLAQTSNNEPVYGAAYGRQIHQQWYSELGYLNLFDYSNSAAEARGDALYFAMLGKASGEAGELFYKVGVARVNIAANHECEIPTVVNRCNNDKGIVAGVVGLGFDYYVALKSAVRFEYVYISGEDRFSTHIINLGFRYNLN